jgi:hypothetical protein
MKAIESGLIAYIVATSAGAELWNASAVGAGAGRLTLTVPVALDLQKISIVLRAA